MLAGTGLLAGGGRWIVAFPVYVVLVEVKLHIEEGFMLAEFPDDYPRYRRRVPSWSPACARAAARRSLPKLFLNGINDILIRPGSRENSRADILFIPAAFR